MSESGDWRHIDIAPDGLPAFIPNDHDFPPARFAQSVCNTCGLVVTFANAYDVKLPCVPLPSDLRTELGDR